MDDSLEHFHMYDYRARCAVAITTNITRELQKRHQLDPITTIAIGRAVSCVALLASILKTKDEYFHAQFISEAHIKRIMVECNGAGDCRGYILPENIAADGPLPESVAEALGHSGMLIVTRGRYGQEPYRAVKAFHDGGIATDFAHYLTESEQIPSAVAAGVKLSKNGEVLAAGALLFQKLAGTDLDETSLSKVEERMTNSLNLSERLSSGETSAKLIELLQGSEGKFGLLNKRTLQFRCTCSREKMAATLYSLGEQELKAIKEETGRIEMRCHYCSSIQQFRLEELLTQ